MQVTGMSLNQLNNWFSNARRRVLKKMKSDDPQEVSKFQKKFGADSEIRKVAMAAAAIPKHNPQNVGPSASTGNIGSMASIGSMSVPVFLPTAFDPANQAINTTPFNPLQQASVNLPINPIPWVFPPNATLFPSSPYTLTHQIQHRIISPLQTPQKEKTLQELPKEEVLEVGTSNTGHCSLIKDQQSPPSLNSPQNIPSKNSPPKVAENKQKECEKKKSREKGTGSLKTEN